MNHTHLRHVFRLMGAHLKGTLNQSVSETRGVNVYGSYLIRYKVVNMNSTLRLRAIIFDSWEAL